MFKFSNERPKLVTVVSFPHSSLAFGPLAILVTKSPRWVRRNARSDPPPPCAACYIIPKVQSLQHLVFLFKPSLPFNFLLQFLASIFCIVFGCLGSLLFPSIILPTACAFRRTNHPRSFFVFLCFFAFCSSAVFSVSACFCIHFGCL